MDDMEKIFDAAAVTGAVFTAALFGKHDPILAFIAAPAGGLIIAPVVVGLVFGVRRLRRRVVAIWNSPSRKSEFVPPGVVWC